MFYLIKKLLDRKWKEFKVKNKLGTYEIDKISLSCFDDKRYLLDDGIHILSYFHKNSVKSCDNLWLFYWWLLLMIIDDYYWWLIIITDSWWWLLLIIICYCNKTNFSSSIYKVIRPVLNLLFFFYDKISQVQKSTKKH